MKEIKLTQGKVALVDDSDYEYLNQWKWYTDRPRKNYVYARRTIQGINNKRIVCLKMHRVIMNTPKGMQVDHIDHNGLNNQKSNLRNCFNYQNARNQNKHKESIYKGVYYRVKNEKFYFYAHIGVNYKLINLGGFKTAIGAARAYDEAAIKYHKKFANLNFK